MSDYDFEGGYTVWDKVGKAVIGLVLCTVLGLLWYSTMTSYTPANETIANQHALEQQQLFASVQKTLNDPNVTCEQIQQYRQEHVQNINTYKDPLAGSINFDLDRDLWNSKNCGVHWGWFES